MNLVRRYVAEVRRHLPIGIRFGVSKELQGLLDDELETLGQQQGAPLQDDDIAKFLKRYGHPYKVAVSYRLRRTLVSEKAYPLYRRVLAAALAWTIVVCVFLTLGRITQNHVWGITEIPQFFYEVLSFLPVSFTIVTLYFHYYGNSLSMSPKVWRWDPRKLPELDLWWDEISLLSSAIVIIQLVVALALVTLSTTRYTDDVFYLQVHPTVVSYLPALQVVALIGLAVWLVNLFQRYWTRLKLLIVSACAIVSGSILLRLILAPDIFNIVVTLPPKAPSTTALEHLFAWWPDKPLRVIEWLSHLPFGVWPNLFPVKLMLLVVGGTMLYRSYLLLRATTHVKMPFL